MIEEQIADFKKRVDMEIERFLDGELLENKQKGSPGEILEAIDFIRTYILRGGKRLRPFLFYYSYGLSGGKEDMEEILKVSVALEFLHTYFLIHDDIIDCDNLRHGGLAMHSQYVESYKSQVGDSDLRHFGVSMAIVVGDLVSSWVYKVILNADFDVQKKIEAMRKISEITSDTLAGEMIDQTLGASDSFDEDLIFRVGDYKTARYTVAAPLEMGAVLSGADQKEIDYILHFSIPLGVAFQIKDDMIGLFGDGKKTGKPVGSDIKEGKKTLLISYATSHSSEVEKNFLLSCLGNKYLEESSVIKIRQIVEESGSLVYANAKIEELSNLFKNNLRENEELFKKYAFTEDLSSLLLKRDI
jgi:geranylgeranyl diphosphate synthase type I